MTGSRADVCLYLEGTYPFVPGGVSSWVHQITSGLPDLTFALVHLGPRPGHYEGLAYELPLNVVALEQGWLSRPRAHRRTAAPRRLVAAFWEFTAALRRGDHRGLAALAGELRPLQERPDMVDHVLHSRQAWQELRAAYEAEAREQSFVDWYWHQIGINQPLLHALATRTPDAACHHTVSTGYAGLLASLSRHRTRRPLVLTEHGIYTKERRIELHSAEWIREVGGEDILPSERQPFFRRQWNRQFESWSRICYAASDRIVTLYEGNRLEQVRDGADPARTAIVRNGIDLQRYEPAVRRHNARVGRSPFTIGFCGRIAPIKDLRTFLSAARLVAQEVTDLRVVVMGPEQDDPDYARECREHLQQTGLSARVEFTGRVDLTEHLGEVDVLVLTSISEAQPLVVLEAGAVGMPVVCTDVGSCRELLHGCDAEDRKLGPGGILVPIASPGATAHAILDLWREPDLRRRLGDNLHRRVRIHYSERAMLNAYGRIYGDAIAAPDAAIHGSADAVADGAREPAGMHARGEERN